MSDSSGLLAADCMEGHGVSACASSNVHVTHVRRVCASLTLVSEMLHIVKRARSERKAWRQIIIKKETGVDMRGYFSVFPCRVTGTVGVV